MAIESQPESATPARIGFHRETLKLSIVFGAFYFVQGIAEPTEGLIGQPIKSLLRSWGLSVGELAGFTALVGVPWNLKPLYGLTSDFLPLGGYRRKSYLLVCSGVTVAFLLALAVIPLPAGSTNLLLAMLLPVSLAVAFSDVVVDGLMVEKGQPLGITGRLQSVQWTTIWSASIFTGVIGGEYSNGGQQTAFLLCGLFALATFVSSWTVVEQKSRCDAAALRRTLGELWRSTHSQALLAAAAFLSLWSFNPFSTDVLYVHMKDGLKFDDELIGETRSVLAVGSMLASGAYGFYCHRVSFRILIHLCIVLGIASNLIYWRLEDAMSAYLISFVFGAINATAVMVQLDLAARRCPPAVAGTMFALLMSLSNLGTSLSGWWGGNMYDSWIARWGAVGAFNALVGVGALFTAGCWLLAPLVYRAAPEAQNSHVS